MNKSAIAKMIADTCKEAVRDAMRFVNTETPVAAAVAAPAKAADDVQARRLAGLERARAAKKAKAQAAVTKPAVAAVVKPAKTPKSAAAWTVKPHVTKKGAKGKIVTVGPFNAWVEEGDTEKEKALFDAINKVFRSDEAVKLAAAITG